MKLSKFRAFETVYTKSAVVLLSMVVGCSGPNSSSLNADSNSLLSLDDGSIENFLSDPGIDNAKLAALDKRPFADVFSFKGVKIPRGASVVVAGKRVSNVDVLFQHLQGEVQALSKKYRTYGDFRRSLASSRQVDDLKSQSATAKSIIDKIGNDSVSLVGDNPAYGTPTSLQLFDASKTINSMVEGAKSCASSLGETAAAAGATVNRSLKAYAGWASKRAVIAQAGEAAAATAAAGVAASTATAAASGVASAEAFAAIANPVGLAITAAVIGGGAVYYMVKNCKSGETHETDSQESADMIARDQVQRDCTAEGDCHTKRETALDGGGGSVKPVN